MNLTSIRRPFRGIAATAAIAMTAVTFATLGTPAHANDAVTVRSMAVKYADLDLATDAGNRALYLRLSQAARSVCGTADGRDLRALGDLQRCKSEAMERAVTEIGSVRLATLHRASSAG